MKYLGQWFTKYEKVKELWEVIFDNFNVSLNNMSILDPSCGKQVFIKTLVSEYKDLCEDISSVELEIDNSIISENSEIIEQDFFEYPMENKFNIIVGNPPFSKKTNIETFYHFKNSHCFNPFKHEKTRLSLEKAFIFKSLEHLFDSNNMLAFVLPVSFWANRNGIKVKSELLKRFKNVLIYQDTDIWFEGDDNLNCCFSVFTNFPFKKPKPHESHNIGEEGKIKQIYRDELGFPTRNTIELNEENIQKNLIPISEYYFSKLMGKDTLSDFIDPIRRIKHKKYDVSGKNIAEYMKYEPGNVPKKGLLYIGRVGMGILGKAGIIEKDVKVSECFYPFKFKKGVTELEKIQILNAINENREFFLKAGQKIGQPTFTIDEMLRFKLNVEKEWWKI